MSDEVRPEYPLRCEECGRAHILDTVIPSNIWNQIAGRGEILCVVCIDNRLAKAGLETEAEFYFVGKALKSRLYPGDSDSATAAVLNCFGSSEPVTTSQINLPGLTRKEIFNTLTYLTRKGKLERLGYGRYRKVAA